MVRARADGNRAVRHAGVNDLSRSSVGLVNPCCLLHSFFGRLAPTGTEQARMKRHFSMIRDFHLADWFTLANAFCGTGAVFAAMRFLQDGVVRDLLVGMALIPLAFVFDALDGRVARWRNSASTLGRELDSLADVISFGVAPAALAYACGLQGGWDWVVLSYFVGCGVSRLARYNVTAEQLSGGGDKVAYFEGTPIPTSLVLVMVLAAAALTGNIGREVWLGMVQLGPWQLHPLVLLFALSGSLMISKTVRIPKP
jgi:CDP-diacylglycerol---serine O-phosphatidyltransferase